MTTHEVYGSVLVVGGGIAGMQASLDLAESGYKVYIVEEGPAIGGRMAQLDKTFPTNDCAMCTLAPRMVDAGSHINIERLTYSEVISAKGGPGHFEVTVMKKARSIDPEKCTGCGECTLNCPVQYESYSPALAINEPRITPEARAQVEEIVQRYVYKKAPLIPVLQAINTEFNYLPEEVLRYISHRLGISLARILRVATFYSLFSLKPRGKHILTICQGTSCFVRGGEMLLARLQDMLRIQPGEVTPDGKFSLEIVRCVGCCALAPALRIGKQTYAKVHANDLSRILGRY
jgi:NADH:ubiquinone oxidoreductase subunit E/NAD-dependent dihydropyrimidine dehydrogenase PreA subunit